MKKFSLQVGLLLILICQITADNLQGDAAFFAPALCNEQLYKALKDPSKNLTGKAATLDLFQTMKKTSLKNSRDIWYKISTYDRNPNIQNFIDLLDRSYQLEQIYAQAPMEYKLSYDYSICHDLCETYYIPSPTVNLASAPSSSSSSSAATAKPESVQNKCSDVLDDRFCNFDFDVAKKQKDNNLFNFMMKRPFQYKGGKIIYYERIVPADQLQYCYTYDPVTQLIVHACEKYRVQQYYHNMQVSMRTGRKLELFSDVDRDRLLQSKEVQQIDELYILSKYKFGEELGRIYNDCKRYGPM